MIEFPKSFLWGAALSAYQAEGNNINSDWWPWEKKTGHQSSGDACRHYELYKEDFDLACQLNHNCHRFSIEWARIEPEEGKFDDGQINHYRQVLLALRGRGLEPVVTLHHFTNPNWIADIGGWENKKTADFFLRYVQRVSGALAGEVRFWITVNEPLVYAYHSYILGVWPPQKKSFLACQKVSRNLAQGHIEAYRMINSVYAGKSLSAPMISIAKNIQYFEPCIPSFRNKIAAFIRDKIYNFDFLDKIKRAKTLDFIGVNYYSHNLVELRGWGPVNFATDCCDKNHSKLKKNSLGWDICPFGLYKMLIKLNRYKLPMFITENGICTEDDDLRWEYIREHLKSVHRAISEGAKVMGYLYWSLLDNFEWDKGFTPRFGLIHVDYQTYKRTVRQSAVKFADVCKNNRLA